VEVKARALEVGLALALVAAASLAGLPVWWTGLAFTAGAGLALLWLSPRVAALGVSDAGESLRPLLIEGWPFLGLALLAQLLFRLDLFLLEALGRSREEVGFYGAASALVWGLLTLPQLLALAVYPTLSRAAAAARGPRREALAAAGLGAGLGALLALGLWSARRPLVALAFGAEFEPTAALVATLAWALPGGCAAMLLGTVLAAWRGQRLALAVQAAAIAAALALNLGWIPELGALGAARAAVLVQTALATALLAALLARRAQPPAQPSPVSPSVA